MSDNGVHLPNNQVILVTSWKELLLMIPKRLLSLAGKMIGIKMLILYGATALLLFTDKFPAWAWLVVVAFVIAGREALKYIKDIK